MPRQGREWWEHLRRERAPHPGDQQRQERHEWEEGKVWSYGAMELVSCAMFHTGMMLVG